jgi:hypothetical protein
MAGPIEILLLAGAEPFSTIFLAPIGPLLRQDSFAAARPLDPYRQARQRRQDDQKTRLERDRDARKSGRGAQERVSATLSRVECAVLSVSLHHISSCADPVTDAPHAHQTATNRACPLATASAHAAFIAPAGDVGSPRAARCAADLRTRMGRFEAHRARQRTLLERVF